jgi:hypothetical protein
MNRYSNSNLQPTRSYWDRNINDRVCIFKDAYTGREVRSVAIPANRQQGYTKTVINDAANYQVNQQSRPQQQTRQWHKPDQQRKPVLPRDNIPKSSTGTAPVNAAKSGRPNRQQASKPSSNTRTTWTQCDPKVTGVGVLDFNTEIIDLLTATRIAALVISHAGPTRTETDVVNAYSNYLGAIGIDIDGSSELSTVFQTEVRSIGIVAAARKIATGTAFVSECAEFLTTEERRSGLQRAVNILKKSNGILGRMDVAKFDCFREISEDGLCAILMGVEEEGGSYEETLSNIWTAMSQVSKSAGGEAAPTTNPNRATGEAQLISVKKSDATAASTSYWCKDKDSGIVEDNTAVAQPPMLVRRLVTPNAISQSTSGRTIQTAATRRSATTTTTTTTSTKPSGSTTNQVVPLVSSTTRAANRVTALVEIVTKRRSLSESELVVARLASPVAAIQPAHVNVAASSLFKRQYSESDEEEDDEDEGNEQEEDSDNEVIIASQAAIASSSNRPATNQRYVAEPEESEVQSNPVNCWKAKFKEQFGRPPSKSVATSLPQVNNNTATESQVSVGSTTIGNVIRAKLKTTCRKGAEISPSGKEIDVQEVNGILIPKKWVGKQFSIKGGRGMKVGEQVSKPDFNKKKVEMLSELGMVNELPAWRIADQSFGCEFCNYTVNQLTRILKHVQDEHGNAEGAIAETVNNLFHQVFSQ